MDRLVGLENKNYPMYYYPHDNLPVDKRLAISYRHLRRSRAKAVSILLAMATIITVGLIWGGFNNSSITLSAKAISPSYTQAHRLRPIGHHKVRALCSNPGRGQAHCQLEAAVGSNGQPLTGTPDSLAGYGPAQFHTAYNLPCTPGGSVQSVCSAPSSFGPQTIAIVDAGNFSGGSSGLASSLADYDQYYSLPSCTLTNGCLNVVNQSGSSSSLPGTVSTNWSDEIVLDVETAHMVCQTCAIVLVEANDATITNLAIAEEEAASFDPVSISNSWGGSFDETAYDSDFVHPGIATVAATGDTGSIGSGADWPADNPDVVAVSGTTLELNEDNSWASESVWSDSGGGCSDYYSAPSWQTSLSDWAENGCGTYRAFGDVSADADPNTGATINISSTWYEFGGTSLAAPIIASIFALTGGIPSNVTASSIPYDYYGGSDFHNISSGSDCVSEGQQHCTASAGFNTPSGIGSPNGINGFMSLPSQPTNLKATYDSGTELSLSWTASTASDGISGYYIYRNNTEIDTTTGTNYTDNGLTPDNNYNYYVVAYDNNGNLSTASATITGSTYLPEDINEDGHVNLLDLSLLAEKYNQSGPDLGRADINGDGTVNLLDLSLLASKYNSE